MSFEKGHRIFKLFLKFVAVFLISFALIVALTNAVVIFRGSTHVLRGGPPVEFKEFVLVLGAGVRGEALSGALRGRMDTALGLYNNHLAGKILLSGDGLGAFYNETLAMQKFAIRNHVPADNVLLDKLGVSTYASIVRAREVFHVRSAYIVSQDFHLDRAVYLAQSVGIEAVGIPAPSVSDEWFYRVREIPARSKDLIFVLFDVRPIPSLYR